MAIVLVYDSALQQQALISISVAIVPTCGYTSIKMKSDVGMTPCQKLGHCEEE